VVDAARLHRRRRRTEAGRTLLEGPHLVGEAVAAGVVPATIFALDQDTAARGWAQQAGCELLTVTPEVLGRIATTETPQSPVAIIEIPDDGLPPVGSVLVAWGISDPGNAGTLIRTAAAFGLSYAAGPDTADTWSPKVLRAGAGAHFRAPVAAVASLDDLADRTLVATVVSGGVSPRSLPAGDLAVMVGDEAAGLPDAVLTAADVAVTIPMPGGIESLNAAVAGAIVAYEIGLRGGGEGGANLPSA
jgi:TrmH family RNA methyltransferase